MQPVRIRRRIAVTRQISPAIMRCELTHREREPIDLELARAQHRQYEECLVSLGCELRRLPPDPDLPDSVFVEDTAVVLDELAVVTRPGASSRREEIPAIASVLALFRPLRQIEDPGTLDGGDVLRVERTLYVGRSARTNRAGTDQLAAFLRPHGYEVREVPISGCLHLKSAVTQVAEQTLLVNRRWVDTAEFDGYELVDVHPEEPWAANVLCVGGTVICSAACPRTRARLEERGIPVRAVALTELAKAEGGLTCCSLIFTA